MLPQVSPTADLLQMWQGANESYLVSILDDDGAAVDLSSGFMAEAVLREKAGDTVLETFADSDITLQVADADGINCILEMPGTRTAEILVDSSRQYGAAHLIADIKVTTGGEVAYTKRLEFEFIQTT